MKKEYFEIARYYDLFHNEKDYFDEVGFFSRLIEKFKKSRGKRLLDIACGTGSHVKYFKERYDVFGIDKSMEMINIARKKNLDVGFVVGDMVDLNVDDKFDVVTLLFSSVVYLRSLNELEKAFGRFYDVLNEGGVLLIETLFLRDGFSCKKEYVREYIDDDLFVSRVVSGKVKEGDVILNARYLIKKKGREDLSFGDKMKIRLYSKKEMVGFLRAVGFGVEVVRYEKNGTWVFVCVKD